MMSKVPHTQRHSMPVAIATVAWNLLGCLNDVESIPLRLLRHAMTLRGSASSAPSVRDK